MSFLQVFTRLFTLLGVLFILLPGCSRLKLDGVFPFIPEDASSVWSFSDTTHLPAGIPSGLIAIGNSYHFKAFVLVRCPVSKGERNWLYIGTGGNTLSRNARKIQRRWSYKGNTIEVIKEHTGAEVTVCQIGGVVLLSPRTLLIEEAIERRYHWNRRWKRVLKPILGSGNYVIWNSRLAFNQWLPEGNQFSGLLKVPLGRTRSRDSVDISFIPRDMPNTKTLRAFPFRMVSLIPEDAYRFTYPDRSSSSFAQSPFWGRFTQDAAASVALLTGEGADSFSRVLIVERRSDAAAASMLTRYYGRFTQKRISYQSFTFRQLSDTTVPQFEYTKPWVLELEGLFIVAQTSELLERWVDYYRIGATLEKKLAQVVPSREVQGLFWQYHSFSSGIPAWLDLGFEQTGKGLSALVQTDSGWTLRVWQLRRSILGTPEEALIWRKTFGEDVAQFFSLAGTPYVGVQLENHLVHLVEARSGEIRWSVQVDSRLFPEIYQVRSMDGDAYTWLMSSRDAIYQVDERGALMPGFPIRLRARATAGLAFLPGHSGLGGSFYFPSENKRIYGYALSGTPLGAWNPGPETGMVGAPLVVFSDTGKDFVCGVNDLGRLFVLDAQARPHFAIPELAELESGSLQVDLTVPNKRLAALDNSQKIQVVNLSGAHFPLAIGRGKAVTAQFVFADFTGDNRKDYLLRQGRNLKLAAYFNTQFRTVWTKQLAIQLDTLVVIEGPEKKRIALGAKAARTWTVLNEKGDILPGFPVGGSLGLKWSAEDRVITALDHTLICWKIPRANE